MAAVNDRYPRRKISAERTIESANFPGRKGGNTGGKSMYKLLELQNLVEKIYPTLTDSFFFSDFE